MKENVGLGGFFWFLWGFLVGFFFQCQGDGHKYLLTLDLLIWIHVSAKNYFVGELTG